MEVETLKRCCNIARPIQKTPTRKSNGSKQNMIDRNTKMYNKVRKQSDNQTKNIHPLLMAFWTQPKIEVFSGLMSVLQLCELRNRDVQISSFFRTITCSNGNNPFLFNYSKQVDRVPIIEAKSDNINYNGNCWTVIRRTESSSGNIKLYLKRHAQCTKECYK
jgi:hypothetical protein